MAKVKPRTTWREVEVALDAYADEARDCGHTFSASCQCIERRTALEHIIRAYAWGMKGRER